MVACLFPSRVPRPANSSRSAQLDRLIRPPSESGNDANAQRCAGNASQLGISQEEFAKRFGLSLRTVQQWEQKRRVPDGPASLLLRVIADNPKAVERGVEIGRAHV